MVFLLVDAQYALRQHFPDRLRPRIRQRQRSRADVVVVLMVDAEGLENRGEELSRAHFAFDDRVPVVVALAMHAAAFDPAPGEGDAPGAGEVVAAEAGVDLRRTAEFRERD